MNSRTRAPAGGRRTARRAWRAQHLSTAARASRIARFSLLAAAGILVGGVTLGSAFAVQRAVTGSTAEVATAATGVQLVDHEGLAPGLEEVRIAFAATSSPSDAANRLLAIAPDGSAAAIASQIGPAPATLTLAGRDGSAQTLSLPGLISAGFSPDGAWIATIDGAGAIWRVPASGVGPSRLAAGPFIGTPIVEDGGSVLALRVSSIEAPIVSRLVRVSPSGSVTVLAADDLVYGAQLMADGTIAFATHVGSRTLMKQLAAGAIAQVADLGEDAVNAVLGPNRDVVAFERSGQAFLRRLGDGADVSLGAGSRPQFAPDGRSVLVERGSGSALLALDGRPMASFDSQAGFAACAEACQP